MPTSGSLFVPSRSRRSRSCAAAMARILSAAQNPGEQIDIRPFDELRRPDAQPLHQRMRLGDAGLGGLAVGQHHLEFEKRPPRKKVSSCAISIGPSVAIVAALAASASRLSMRALISMLRAMARVVAALFDQLHADALRIDVAPGREANSRCVLDVDDRIGPDASC